MVDCHSNVDGWEGSYTVLMWCSWFNILADIASKNRHNYRLIKSSKKY